MDATINTPVIHNLSTSLSVNNTTLKQTVFKQCTDVVFRHIRTEHQTAVTLVYVDGMTDQAIVDEFIIRPLTVYTDLITTNPEQCLQVGKLDMTKRICDIEQRTMKGDVAILVDGLDYAILASVSGFELRSIEKPLLEATIRGPRESFIENLSTNMTMIRRKIPNARLKAESFKFGDLTRTDVLLLYIDGIASERFIQIARDRLNKKTGRELIDLGYVEEWLQDNPISPFPQIQNSERPDVTAAALLEGKVAVLADGSPSVLIAPMTFWAGLQSPDDYYERFWYGTAIRWIRYVMVACSLLLPALYVALSTFNPELIPASLLDSIAAAREQSPFPTIIETILMMLVFEGLHEAGIRLPNQLGPIVSIVGALVIGEAAVRAGIISSPIVMVVALTGISTYIIPRYSLNVPFRILRLALLVVSGIFGTYGLFFGLSIILTHIITLTSFGIPYFSPIAPTKLSQLPDVVIRAPEQSRRIGGGR